MIDYIMLLIFTISLCILISGIITASASDNQMKTEGKDFSEKEFRESVVTLSILFTGILYPILYHICF